MAIVLGGYEAKQCAVRTLKDHHPGYREVEQDEIPAGDLARMTAGNAFEQKVGELLTGALGDGVLVVDTCDRSDASKRRREEQTTAAMDDPGHLKAIWNARLPRQARSHRTGEPDLLVRNDEDGQVRWIPVDVKDHRALEGTAKPRTHLVSDLTDPTPAAAKEADLGRGGPRRSDAFQLAHYHRMLERSGHASSLKVGGIIGRELNVLWYDLAEATFRDGTERISPLTWYDREFNLRVEVAKAAIRGENLVEPEWKPECLSCPWRTSCHDELTLEMDHITLLPGITPARAKVHYAAGVTRRSQLARLDHRTATLVDAKVDLQSLQAWATFSDPEAPTAAWNGSAQDRARLTEAGIETAGDVRRIHPATAAYAGTGVHALAGAIDQARATSAGKVYRARGVEKVSVERAAFEQDIDIEDIGGYVYLIGVRTTGYKRVGEDVRRRSEYRPFVIWDDDAESEARNFAAFWDHVTGSQAYAKANRYGYVAYHYGHHEPSTFRKLAERHQDADGVPSVAEVERFFDSRSVVNLHEVVSRELIWPTETTGLKDVAKWVRFSWRDEDPSGDNSMAWYRAAVSDPDEEVREQMRQRLIEYNADDTAAQAAVRDWLVNLGEARKPGIKLGNVADLDRRFGPRR